MDLIKDKSKKVTADKTIAVDKNLVNKIELMPAKELVKEISSYLENDVLIRDGEERECERCGAYFNPNSSECPYCFEEDEFEEERLYPEDYRDDDDEDISEISDYKRNFLFENSPAYPDRDELFMNKVEAFLKDNRRNTDSELYPSDIEEVLYQIFNRSYIEEGIIKLPPEKELKRKISISEKKLWENVISLANTIFEEINRYMKDRDEDPTLADIIIRKGEEEKLYLQEPYPVFDDLALSSSLIKEERSKMAGFLNLYNLKQKRLYYIGEYLIKEERNFLLKKRNMPAGVVQKNIIQYMGEEKHKIDKASLSRIFSSAHVMCPGGEILPLAYFTRKSKMDFLRDKKDCILPLIEDKLRYKEIAARLNEKFPEIKLAGDGKGITVKVLRQFWKEYGRGRKSFKKASL